jgi:signal transduction histidine kinase
MAVDVIGATPNSELVTQMSPARFLEEQERRLTNNTMVRAQLQKNLTALRSLLIASQSAWATSLEGLHGAGSEHSVISRAEDLLEICTQIGKVEAKLAAANDEAIALRERAQFWRQIIAVWAGISDDDGVVIELRGVPVDRISDQLDRLARREHESFSQRLVSGPLQQLADFAVHLEVVEQHVGWDTDAAVKELRRCRAGLSSATDGMRTELGRLRPPRDARECVTQLRAMLKELESAEGRLDVIGDVELMGRDHVVAISRIAEKAIDNAVAHGHAHHIDIALSATPRRVSLVVRDDGDGFDVSATNSRLGRIAGTGIITMRERAEHSGGTLEIRSTIDSGTEVRATFPVSARAPERASRDARQ